MALKILVDSGSDLTYQQAKEMDVLLISMQITIGEKVYQDGIDLDHKTFYHLLKTETVFPKTSLLAPNTYLEEFKKVKKANDELIVITISSALSGTNQSAHLALEMVKYDKIYIIDSLSASLGQRILVEETVKLRKQGLNTLEIIKEIEFLKTKIQAFAMVNTLEYLHKGGRLSKTSAVFGNLVSIKPIITFNTSGKLEIASKSLGKQRAIKTILKLVDQFPIDENYPIYYIYAIDDQDTINLSKLINQKYGHEYQNCIFELGPTIGAHIGPGVLGLIYITK